MINSWSSFEITEPLTDEMVAAGLLWLDFRTSDPHAVRKVTLRDGKKNVRHAWTVSQDNGLIPLAVPPSALSGNGHTITVTSPALLPAHLISVPLRDNQGDPCFPFTEQRLLSSMDWLIPPTYKSPTHKWGGVFGTNACFRLPLPVGMTGGVYTVSFVFSPRFPDDEEVLFRYRSGSRILAAFTNRLSQPQLHHDIQAAAPFDSVTSWPVVLETETKEGFSNHFRLRQIKFRLDESCDPLVPQP
jgi:hypothetical protein